MRDPKAEQWIRAKAVEFYYQVVKITAFDIPESLNNQSRLGITGLIPEVWERYALAMIDGVEFPAIVAYRGKRGLVVINGNHRLKAAAAAEKETIDCYVVQATDRAVLTLLTRTANIIEGVAVDKREARKQALDFAQTYGYSLKEVAQHFHLKVDELESARIVSTTILGLIAEGVKAEGLPDTTLERLHAVRDSKVRAEVASFIQEYGIKGDMQRDLLAAVKAAPDQATQLDSLAAFKGREDVQRWVARQRTGSKPVLRPKRTWVLGWLSTGVTHWEKIKSRADAQLDTDEDIARAAEQLNRIISLAKPILDEVRVIAVRSSG